MWNSRCPARYCHISFGCLDFVRRLDVGDLRSAREIVATNFVPHLADHVERLLASGWLCVQLALNRPIAELFEVAVAVPWIILELETAELGQTLEALQLQSAEIIPVQREGMQVWQIAKRLLLDALQSIV